LGIIDFSLFFLKERTTTKNKQTKAYRVDMDEHPSKNNPKKFNASLLYGITPAGFTFYPDSFNN